MTAPPPSAPAAPSFVLAAPGSTLVADGVRTALPSVADARAVLASGASLVVGALPFRPGSAAALHVPTTHRLTDRPARRAATLPTVRVVAAVPDPDEHRARVRRALVALRDADDPLVKVVLARTLRLAADGAIDPVAVLERLVRADPDAHGYLVDLSPAGGHHEGKVLVGASPELLVVRRGEQVLCRPFAGSAARSTDPATDAAAGRTLAASGKDAHEHAVVVEAVRESLAPLCRDVRAPASPALDHTAAMWHLSSPITATVRDRDVSALDLVEALHPTPAVGGHPTDAALRWIAADGEDRGFYAGAAGWCDAAGDGRWVVSIRCAQLSADRRAAVAHSGGGIVADSDPDDEVRETTAKFATILRALDVLVDAVP